MSEFSHYAEGLHEECGVFGIYDKTGATDMVSAVYSALATARHSSSVSALRVRYAPCQTSRPLSCL